MLAQQMGLFFQGVHAQPSAVIPLRGIAPPYLSFFFQGYDESAVSNIWGNAGELWDRAWLSDWRLAGYQYNRVPIPTPSVTGNIIDDFGAAGDGVTDDTAEFQDAVTNCPDGALLLPAGTYRITDIVIAARNNLVIRGEGIDTTIIDIPIALDDLVPGTYSLGGAFISLRGIELGIENLTIQFPNVAYAGHLNEPGYNALELNQCRNCWVKNVKLVNCDSGLYTRLAHNCTITGVEVAGRNGHYGITVTHDSSYNLITECTMTANEEHVISVNHNASYNVFSNISGTNINLDHHSYVWGPSHHNLWTNINVGTGNKLLDSSGTSDNHSGAGEVFWNIHNSSGDAVITNEINFGRSGVPFQLAPRGVAVGATTDNVGTQYIEAVDPSLLEPQNLHEAQLALPALDLSVYVYRQTFPIAPGQIATNQVNFAAAIHITSSHLATYALANGDDIIFTDADGLWQLPHRIVSYNAGDLWAWVFLPYAEVGTQVQMYYGNPSATNTELPHAVWAHNDWAVYDMAQNPAGTAPQLIDWTVNGHHGTSAGSMVSGDVVTGQVEQATTFDGVNDLYNVGTLGLFGSRIDVADFMVSWWMRCSVTDTEFVVAGGGKAFPNTFLQLAVNGSGEGPVNAGYISCYVRCEGSTTELLGHVAANTGVTDGNWHQVMWMVSKTGGTPAGTLYAFVDGVRQTTTYTRQESVGTSANFTEFAIGAALENGSPFSFAGGELEIDEFRIILGTPEIDLLDEDYAADVYANQSDPSTSGFWVDDGIEYVGPTVGIPPHYLFFFLQVAQAATTDRQLTMSLVATSSTPDINSIIDRSVAMSLVANTSTSDANATLDRSLSLSLLSNSSTPDVDSILDRQISMSMTGSSSTPDINSILDRSLILSLLANSSTPDINSVLWRSLSLSLLADSSTPDVNSILDRTLIMSLLADSFTPNIDIQISGNRLLTMTLLAESATPDIDAILDRSITMALQGVSSIPDINFLFDRALSISLLASSSTPAIDINTDRQLTMSLLGTSSTPDIDIFIPSSTTSIAWLPIPGMGVFFVTVIPGDVTARLLSMSLVATSSTPNVDARLDRSLSLSMSGISSTPNVDAILQRSISMLLLGTSSTPNIDTVLDRALSMTLLGASSTPDIDIDLSGSRLLTMALLASSLTPDVDAIMNRSLSMALTGTSSTPNVEGILSRALSMSLLADSSTPNVDIQLTGERLLTMALLATSSTPDVNAILARALSMSLAANSSTPDVNGSLARSLSLNLQAASATPDINSVLARALSMALLANSSTPGINISTDRLISMALLATSLTPDIDIDLTGARLIAMHLLANSSTPNINRVLDRALSIHCSAISSTPNVNGHLGRDLTMALLGTSSTPAVNALLINVRQVAMSLLAESSTPNINGILARNLSLSLSGISSTPDIGSVLDRALTMSILGESLTPDQVNIILSGLGIIIDPGVTSLTRRKTIVSL